MEKERGRNVSRGREVYLESQICGMQTSEGENGIEIGGMQREGKKGEKVIWTRGF